MWAWTEYHFWCLLNDYAIIWISRFKIGRKKEKTIFVIVVVGGDEADKTHGSKILSDNWSDYSRDDIVDFLNWIASRSLEQSATTNRSTVQTGLKYIWFAG